MNEDRFLKVAKQAAIEAGKVIQKHVNRFGEKVVKEGDKSNFATRADFESEKTIIKILSASFPKHSIVAEEEGWSSKTSEFIWMIDPLDGTLTFSQNIPYYTVSIGLLQNGKPIVGVINHVAFQHLYWAKSEGGAFLNGRTIQVSKKDGLEEAVGTLDFGHRQKRPIRQDLYLNKLTTRIGYPYSFGSAAVSMALTADGTLDFYVNQAYPWDFAAGTVIVREARGKVTGFDGNEPDWTKERLNIVASNGLIHEQLLEALK